MHANTDEEGSGLDLRQVANCSYVRQSTFDRMMGKIRAAALACDSETRKRLALCEALS